MPTHPLPDDPSLEHLRKDAKRLLKAMRAGDREALAQIVEFHPRSEAAIARFSLADSQLVTARMHGFPNWAALKRHLADIEPHLWKAPRPAHPDSPVDVFLRLACLTYAGWHRSNPGKALRMLSDRPDLRHADIYTAAAVGDVSTVSAMLAREPALLTVKGGALRWEPLLYACYSRLEPTHDSSTLRVARLLLSLGADPNAGFLFDGNYAFTALTGAFGRGEDWHNQPPHPECDALARLLLEAGADPNDSQAVYNRHFKEDDEHLRLLFEFGLGQDKGGPWLRRVDVTPQRLLAEELWSAAKKNFFERVTLLADHGADVNTPSRRNGRTPYEEALRAGNQKMAEFLLERGARRIELDPLETFGLACIAGRRDEARARLAEDPTLLERMGHPGRVDLLHRALDARSRDGIRLIVELGVDINGMVPGTGLDRAVLHSAAGWGGIDMVKFLIDLGADPALRDPTYHATPIGWAQHNQQQEVIAYLLGSASIFDAVRCDGVERVEALLNKDPSLARAHDDWGNPVVFYLHPEMKRLDEMISLLLAQGGDLNARSPNGKTLVDRALANGWTEFVELVRNHGGKRSTDVDGSTART